MLSNRVDCAAYEIKSAPPPIAVATANSLAQVFASASQSGRVLRSPPKPRGVIPHPMLQMQGCEHRLQYHRWL